MELRVLRYFRAVVDEGSISDAAKSLHVTQPTLSRQLAQLETELGTPLFGRGRSGIEVTPQGAVLYRHAKNIIELAERATEEVALSANSVTGVVHIGAGETRAFALIAQACIRTRKKYPGVTFDIHDGPASDLMDHFVRGYYDFLLDCDSSEHSDFNQMQLPLHDTWGIVMRHNDPLAALNTITPQDLVGRDVITSPQGNRRMIGTWAGEYFDQMNVVSTYNLPLNAKFMVQEGLGILFSYGGLIDNPRSADGLCFRPLSPTLEAHHKVLWRKVMPTKQAQAFLVELSELCS